MSEKVGDRGGRVMPSWRVGRGPTFDGHALYDGDAMVGVMESPEVAARVVRAVNRHDELVAALRALTNQDFQKYTHFAGACDHARALLARIDAEETGGG
jgi:hypothetical protein